jgi:hypothetical protein
MSIERVGEVGGQRDWRRPWSECLLRDFLSLGGLRKGAEFGEGALGALGRAGGADGPAVEDEVVGEQAPVFAGNDFQ